MYYPPLPFPLNIYFLYCAPIKKYKLLLHENWYNSPTVGNAVLTKGTLHVRTHVEKFSKSPPSQQDHLRQFQESLSPTPATSPLDYLGEWSVADPDLQIRGGEGRVGHPDPEVMGGPHVKKKLFLGL